MQAKLVKIEILALCEVCYRSGERELLFFNADIFRSFSVDLRSHVTDGKTNFYQR